MERHVKLFKNAVIKRCGFRESLSYPARTQSSVIIEPVPPNSLLAILATLATLDEEFPPIEDGPAEPVDL